MQTAIGVASSLIALGAYVYLLGGFVLWLKFTAARLPTDDAVGALDGNRMLAVGLKALAFELFLIGVLLVVAFLAWEAARITDFKRAKKQQKEARKAEKDVKGSAGDTNAVQDAEEAVKDAKEAMAKAAVLNRVEKWEAWRKGMQALIVAILAGSILSSLSPWLLPLDHPPWLEAGVGVLAGAFWLLVARNALLERADTRRKRRALKTWLTVVAALLAVLLLAAPAGIGVLVLLLFLHLSHLLKELHKVTDPAHLVPAVLIVAGCLSLVVATYLATPPVSLDNAVVTLAGEKQRLVRGGYVGRSGDAVYLAVCAPEEDPTKSATTHLRVVASKDIRKLVLGGQTSYVFDDGQDPSLFDMARQVVSRDPLDEKWDTVAMDVRVGALTCGFPHGLTIAKRHRNPLTGGTSLETTVPDEGRLILTGDQLRSQRIKVDAGRRLLPVEPRPEIRAAHRCEGPFKAKVRVAFVRDGRAPEVQRTIVTMPGIWGEHRGRQAEACRRAWVHQRRPARFRRLADATNAR